MDNEHSSSDVSRFWRSNGGQPFDSLRPPGVSLLPLSGRRPRGATGMRSDASKQTFLQPKMAGRILAGIATSRCHVGWQFGIGLGGPLSIFVNSLGYFRLTLRETALTCIRTGEGFSAKHLMDSLEALHIPLALKYRCPSSSTWKLGVASLLSALHVGLPIAHANPAMFEDMWADLAVTLEEFLFSDSAPPPNQSLEEQQNDETLDTRVIQLIRECILPHASKMPKIFVLRIVALLNKGSIHSATSSAPVDAAVSAGLERSSAVLGVASLVGSVELGPDEAANTPNSPGQGLAPSQSPTHNTNQRNPSSWPPTVVVSVASLSRPALADVESSRKLREEFAKACFETLLQFSFLEGNAVTLQQETNLSITDGPMAGPVQSGSMPQQNAGVVSKLAITSLLHRFEEVISSYVEDERLSGKCPLPRHRMSEISFVLKAIATLIASLKTAPRSSVDPSVWKQLIALYPSLVKCTTSSSPQVCRSLRESLHEYADLLSPPS
ncbi:protein MON2-like [Tropilaelaps mercedesae]|uniref:Protein MON2-like n=1 Tax=Tropilaelaps mercedesae TaxID=418985 RepID=A0A1V9X7T9_9ACAR|nr:protein MON2-like [Tropilaelaps mercedesae]